MFQFSYKLKVAERVKAKCERHPRYNPEREGRGGIKGGCSTCFSLFDLHQARLSLDAAHREFLRRALPWTRVRRSRTKPQLPKQDEPPIQIRASESRGCVCSHFSLQKSAQWCQKVPLSSRLEGRCQDSPTQRRAAGHSRGCYETILDERRSYR